MVYRKVSNEDKQALLDLVVEEIELYKNGKINYLSSNKELSDLMGICSITIKYYLKPLNNNIKKYRHSKIVSQNNKKLNASLEFRESARERMKYLWSDPEFREKNKERMIELQSNPEFKERLKKRGREMMKRLHSNFKFKEELRERSRKNGRELSEKNVIYKYKRLKYHSMSEAAIANLLEKYIQEFKIIKGKTWQINGSVSKTIDFLINNEFMEYHPILKFYGKCNGGFKNYKEYQIYQQEKEKVGDKNKFNKFVDCLLTARYLTSRLEAIAESEYNFPLVFCASIEDVHDKIISKYSDVSKEQIVSEYKQLKKEIKALQTKSG